MPEQEPTKPTSEALYFAGQIERFLCDCQFCQECRGMLLEKIAHVLDDAGVRAMVEKLRDKK